MCVGCAAVPGNGLRKELRGSVVSQGSEARPVPAPLQFMAQGTRMVRRPCPIDHQRQSRKLCRCPLLRVVMPPVSGAPAMTALELRGFVARRGSEARHVPAPPQFAAQGKWMVRRPRPIDHRRQSRKLCRCPLLGVVMIAAGRRCWLVVAAGLRRCQPGALCA